MDRPMKIYTKTGDTGTTALFRGGRVPKDSPRIEACGAVDELNCHLGGLRSLGLPDEYDRLLHRVQSDLFAIGAVLSTAPSDAGVKPRPKVSRAAVPALPEGTEQYLEDAIDRMESFLPPLRNFILPGGSPASAAAHLARAVCRRAERAAVALHRKTPLPPSILTFLNRLSDFLFVLARRLNQLEGKPEEVWKPSQSKV